MLRSNSIVLLSDAPLREHDWRVVPDSVDANAGHDDAVIRHETGVVDAYFTNRDLIRYVSGRCSDVLFNYQLFIRLGFSRGGCPKLFL
jgi:hypothetical protein